MFFRIFEHETVRLIGTRQKWTSAASTSTSGFGFTKTTSVMSTISGMDSMDFCHIESSSEQSKSTKVIVVATMSMFGNTSTSKVVPMSGTTGTGTPGTTSFYSFCFSFSLPVSTQLTSRKLAGIDGTAIGKIESSSGYHMVAGPKHPKYPCGKASCLNHMLNLLNCCRR